MTSSALTGNTSGLASATSPGLVGTGTQTFAGKKTLDGGALIKGDTTGTSIPANYIGEAKYVTVGFTNLTSAAWTSLGSITLHAGIWLVSANVEWIRNGATITTNTDAASCIGSSIADITANYASKYTFRSVNETPNTPAATIIGNMGLPVSSVYIRSDGTNLYFVDGSTLASASQGIVLGIYTSAFTGGPCQAAGTMTAVLIG